MVDLAPTRPGLIDLSFMASLECDLACAHCMYSSSPRTTERLDYERVAAWVQTVDWTQVHACGFYGGEPAILLDWYSQFVELVPREIPKFCITNGAWSRSWLKTMEFVLWAERYSLSVVVSGTRWHTPYQDRARLEELAASTTCYVLKGEEAQIIPMGRGENLLMAPAPKRCTQVCLRWTKPWRVALHPTRGIIFQSCDGRYPHLQSLEEPFSAIVPNIEGRLLPLRRISPCTEGAACSNS